MTPQHPEHPERRETDWLFQRLNTLEDKMDAQHNRVREVMNAGFKELEAQVDKLSENHSGRILIIETERSIEKREAIRRGTWAGLAAASGLTLLMELFKRYVLGKP